MSVAIDRPTSWYLCWLPTGPSWMKINRVGTHTSVRSASSTAFCRRIKATRGSVRQSTSPMRIFDASAPGGTFFRKCSLNYTDMSKQSTSNVKYAQDEFTIYRYAVHRESHAAARKLRDAKAILFGLKFANDIHYKLRCSQASIKQGFRAPSILLHCVWCLVQPSWGFMSLFLWFKSW